MQKRLGPYCGGRLGDKISRDEVLSEGAISIERIVGFFRDFDIALSARPDKESRRRLAKGVWGSIPLELMFTSRAIFVLILDL